MIEPLPDRLIAPVVRAALAEDLGRAGDVTSPGLRRRPTRALAPSSPRRKAGVVAGLACARLAIAALDPAADFEVDVATDGAHVDAGARCWPASSANARALLSAERTP